MKVVSAGLENIDKAAEILRNGGVVVAPTDSVYGLFGDALNKKTVERIRGIKGRDGGKPFQIAVSKEDADKYGRLTDDAIKLIEGFWPGDVNIIVEKTPLIPDFVSKETICMTCHHNPIASALVRKTGPLISTSVNLSGMPPATKADEIAREVADEVDLILDGGKTKHGRPNTIVDLTKKPTEVVREGSVTREMLDEVY